MLEKKKETLKTVVDTIEKNQKFKKLLLYFLNSLEVFISPPNREIKQNAKIILDLNGVKVLKTISMANIHNEDIIQTAADIIWKLISVWNVVDAELAKAFVDAGGHEAVIEILLQKDEGPGSLPLIETLNGIVQIPSLVNPLLDAGLAQVVKLVNDLYPNDMEIIALNFDTMKKISNQKNGREFLVDKGLVPSILENINKVAEQGDAKAVLNGLAVLDNIARNDDGKQALKDADAIVSLSSALNYFDENEDVLKNGAKIFSKIANEEDMIKLLQHIQECASKIEGNKPLCKQLKPLEKDFAICGNLMLLDNCAKIACQEEHLKNLKDLYLRLASTPLEGVSDDYMNTFAKTMKNYNVVFQRIFGMMEDCYDKNTPNGQLCSDLHPAIRNSMQKNFEGLDKKIQELATDGDPQQWTDSHYKTLRDFFACYDNLIIGESNHTKEGEEINPDIVKTLEYIDEKIIAEGNKNFYTDDRANNAASKILKLSCDIINKYPNNCGNLNNCVQKCFPYMIGTIQINDNYKTLTNDLEVCDQLATGEGEEKDKNKLDLIPVVVKFMQEKPKFRTPNYENLNILDKYLTPQFIDEMRKNPDEKINPNYKLDYIGSVVSVMSKAKAKKKKAKVAAAAAKTGATGGSTTDKNATGGDTEEKEKEVEPFSEELEGKISDKGSDLLARLVSLEDFLKRLRAFENNVDKYKPGAAKEDELDTLREDVFFQQAMVTNKACFDAMLEKERPAITELIKKEVKWIEDFKRDSSNEKKENFPDIVMASHDRLDEYLGLLKKMDDETIKQANAASTPEEKKKYAQKYKEIFATDCEVFDKSTDSKNIGQVVNQIKKNFPFIMANEAELKGPRPIDPKPTEKVVNSLLKCFRNNITDEELDDDIIKGLIAIVTQQPSTCNTLVKGGCPRLLLQVTENTTNKVLADDALELMKLITLSSNDNLVMVANQNIASELFEVRSKFASEEEITKKCDIIANEIMKIPGQEDQSIAIVKDAIKEFHENAAKDYNNNEIKGKLLGNLEIINSFTTNKKVIDGTIMGKEFFDDLIKTFNNSKDDQETTDRNEGLITNTIGLAKKIQENITPTTEDGDNKQNDIVKALINQIMHKSQYAGPLLTSTRTLGGMLEDEDYYKKYVADKIDESFIDKLFEINDNYLDNPEITKEVNNILSKLCLRNPKLAEHIVAKGGLANVIEELRSIVNMNDEKSRAAKTNGLRMLCALLDNDQNLDTFEKAKGVDLINGIVKNEVNIAPPIKDDGGCMFKTRGPINVKTEEQLKNEEKVAGDEYVPDDDKKKEAEDYFVSAVKIMKKGMDKGKTAFVDDNIIKNLTQLAHANFPDKHLFNEASNILSSDSCVIPEIPADNQNLVKLAASNRARFFPDEDVKNKFDGLEKKVGPQTFKTDDFKNGLKNCIHEEINKPDSPEQRKELNKLATYIALNLDNDDFKNALNDKEDILPLYNKMIETYKPEEDGKPNKDLDDGTGIVMMKLCNHLTDKDALDIKDPKTISDVCHDVLPIYGNPEKYLFNKHYNDELDKLLNKAGRLDKDKPQDKNKPNFTEPYKVYLAKSFPQNIKYLKTYHNDFMKAAQGTAPVLSPEKEYNLDKALEKVYDTYKLRDASDDLIKNALGGEDLESIKGKELIPLCNDQINLIDDISVDGVYKKDEPDNKSNKKMKMRAVKTWKTLNHALVNDEAGKVAGDAPLCKGILSAVDDSMKLGVNIPEFRNIMRLLSNKVGNNDEVTKKIMTFATEDYNTNCDEGKVKEIKEKNKEGQCENNYAVPYTIYNQLDEKFKGPSGGSGNNPELYDLSLGNGESELFKKLDEEKAANPTLRTKNELNEFGDDSNPKSDDLEILANLSKYPEPLKTMMHSGDTWTKIKNALADDNLPLRDRENIDEILRNANKNSFNTEKMVEEEPEVFKHLLHKINDCPYTGDSPEENEGAKKEMEVIAQALSDPNNYKTLMSKGAITDENLKKLASAYVESKPDVHKIIEPVLQQINEENKTKAAADLFAKDEEMVKNLAKTVDAAFDEHKKTLATMGQDLEAGEEAKEEQPAKNALTSASTVRRGRNSFITDTLLFNPNNKEVKSLLSSKHNSEMPQTLDQVLSKLRKLYNDYKSEDDHDMNNKRELLIGECLRTLKQASLSEDNHKPILENGLVNFSEKLANEDLDKNPMQFHLRAKDVLKNCSHSENAIPAIIQSPLFDKLIDELMKFYDQGDEALREPEMRKLFLCDNIIFSNICKDKNGFDTVFNKIGKEKLIEIGEKTGNADILAACMDMLNNYFSNCENLENVPPETYDKVIPLIDKAYNLKGKTPGLLSKAMNLNSMIYIPANQEKCDKLDTVNHIHDDFNKFKNDKEYLNSALGCLEKLTKTNVPNANATVDTGLITGLKDEVNKYPKAEAQELYLKLSSLYDNLVNNNLENCEKFTRLGLADEILTNLNSYSNKVFNANQPKDLISHATINQETLSNINEATPAKSQFLKRMANSASDNEQVQRIDPSVYLETVNNAGEAPKAESDKNNKEICRHLLNALDQIANSKMANEYLGKRKLASFLSELLKNPSADVESISTGLHIFGNHLYELKSQSEDLSLEEVYDILSNLQKQYYSNSDVLTNINYDCAAINRNIDDKEYIKKFFLLEAESTKCQDWNTPLITNALKSMYEDLVSHPFLADQVYEDIFPLLINIQTVNKDNPDIQSNVYKILSLFSQNNVYGYTMLNGGLMETIKNSLENPNIAQTKQGRNQIRRTIFSMLENMAKDEGNAKRISDDLSEYLVNELSNEDSMEDNEPIVRLLSQLCEYKHPLQPFTQYKGIETINNLLKSEDCTPEQAIQYMDLLTKCANGGDEYKYIMQKVGVPDTINQVMKKHGMYDKNVEFKGKSLIYLIGSAKVKLEQEEEVDINDIKIDNPIKPEIRNFLTSGKQVIIVNSQGDKKEMHLSFSQDLLKVSAKKIKSSYARKNIFT
ncbi:MAG: hypothetical protein MJ252_01320 [archaeon]|nr:hypothetical protein [archaeon]